ncbi:class E sortase [Streptomyces sp. CB02959]|uniref:class E sortase n=1 Tax=Streptomyces sp. CB02959 TaxID=2020330 RepID=UPI002153A005|nr:class E sortase [Streptomyces sp. CB02959]
MRERIPVVVQGRRGRYDRRSPAVWALWTGAELAVTLGVVLLLFVVHQLWWTNREAQDAARDQVGRLERQWRDGAAAGPPPAPPADGSGAARPAVPPGGTPPTAPPSGRDTAPATPPRDLAYAILRIPRLGLTAPVAEGIGRTAVLDKGYVGHYPHTAQPGGTGNTALAGHRNTHGEPFRHLDRLRPGDTVVLETARLRATYVVRATLPETTPGDGTVLAPVPRSTVHPGYGFTAPGAYLTLTTCTPEYTSTYRLVVWAVLRTAQPR